MEVLSEIDSQRMYDILQNRFSFTRWGRIDWDNYENKVKVIGAKYIIEFLNKKYKLDDYPVFVLWGYSSGSSPVLKTSLQNAIYKIDYINAIGSDQWLYCLTYKFVIEFYHDGNIFIGFES